MNLPQATMGIWASGTLESLDRAKQPTKTAQQAIDALEHDIATSIAEQRGINGYAHLSIKDVELVIAHMRALETENENLAAANRLHEFDVFSVQVENDYLAGLALEPEPEPEPEVEWLTITEYAKLHGKAYSTVAGKKRDFGSNVKQSPVHAGRWLIRADAPYPYKRKQ